MRAASCTELESEARNAVMAWKVKPYDTLRGDGHCIRVGQWRTVIYDVSTLRWFMKDTGDKTLIESIEKYNLIIWRAVVNINVCWFRYFILISRTMTLTMYVYIGDGWWPRCSWPRGRRPGGQWPEGQWPDTGLFVPWTIRTMDFSYHLQI